MQILLALSVPILDKKMEAIFELIWQKIPGPSF